MWEDIHPNSREFVKKYLKQYPERPMVKLYVAQVVRTEWEGKWWITQVLEVDASLVKLQFKTDGRTEWVRLIHSTSTTMYKSSNAFFYWSLLL